MDWQQHKKILLKNPSFLEALQDNALEYQIARHLLKARVELNLSQQDLAEKLQTRQSVISRVESGKSLPSLSFLRRLASALDLTLEVSFRQNK
ncbi:MAG: helix-turn-helix transcriptional regulator [Patescibacteria group bacterium]